MPSRVLALTIAGLLFMINNGKMQHTVSDEVEKKETSVGFRFKENANIMFSMTDLRSTVNKRFKFCGKSSPLKGN